MRRIFLLVIAGAVVAFGIWYAWRISEKTSSSSVSVLLGRDTIFLAHLPDFNQTRDQWHHSDVYLLYREPAVQDFLRKPLGKFPKRDAASQTLRDIEQLDPKDAFFALTSIDNNNPKFVGGFRFRGSPEDAERVIGKWRSNFLQANRSAKHEKLQYERHEIEMVAATPFALVTAYDRPWFFAASDLTELKALLDRADGRVKNSEETLDADASYRSAAAHMPSSYAASFICNRRHFPTELPHSAQRSARRLRPMNGRSLNKCGVFLERRVSTAEKYTIYFFSECRSWNRMRLSHDLL